MCGWAARAGIRTQVDEAKMDLNSNTTSDPANNEDTLDIKIAQIFIVMVCSFIGMAGPLYFSNKISATSMFLLRAFAAGQLPKKTYMAMLVLLLFEIVFLQG